MVGGAEDASTTCKGGDTVTASSSGNSVGDSSPIGVSKVCFVWKLVTSPKLSWKDRVLEDTSASAGNYAAATEPSPEFLEHIVTCLDTLPGVSLKYNVPVSAIKKCNRMYSSNDIQAYKVLHIPRSSTTSAFVQDPKEIMVQEFKEITGEDEVESRIYLQEASWDIKVAVKAYNEDGNWAVENAHVFANNFANSDLGYSDK